VHDYYVISEVCLLQIICHGVVPGQQSVALLIYKNDIYVVHIGVHIMLLKVDMYYILILSHCLPLKQFWLTSRIDQSTITLNLSNVKMNIFVGTLHWHFCTLFNNGYSIVTMQLKLCGEFIIKAS